MMEEISFSLWLMPEKDVFQRLKKITDKLSKKFGSPEIKPHVTLLGGFSCGPEDAVHKAEKLAEKSSPFEVRLRGIDYTGEFFRSLFLVAEKSEEFAKARAAASKIFGPVKRKFAPHLSLLYGKFSNETKEQIIKELGRNYSAKFTARKVHLVVNNEHDMRWPEVASFSFIHQKP